MYHHQGYISTKEKQNLSLEHHLQLLLIKQQMKNVDANKTKTTTSARL